jgi:molybdopterin synthase catalytic subunit
MKVNVKFFATYREVVGQSLVGMEVEEGLTLGQLLANIYEEHPRLKKWAESIVCSVNKKYADEDAVLKDGDEVALLPPVSGGARIEEGDFHIEELLSSLRTETAGAIVFFVGAVRKDPGVDNLEVEGYPEMAVEKLNEIIQGAKEKFSIEKMEIIHRTGTLDIGENIVAIGVSAPHRKDAFKACEWGIDELKKVVPVWKKEKGEWIGQDD